MVVVRPGVDTCFTVAEGVARRCCAEGLLACPWHMHQRDDGKVLSVLAALPRGPDGGGAGPGGAAVLEERVRRALAGVCLTRDPQFLPLDEILPSLGPAANSFSLLEDVFLPLAQFAILCALQRDATTPLRVLDGTCLTATEDSQCFGLWLEAVAARPHGENEVTLTMLAHPRAPRLIPWRADAADMAAAESAWQAASAEARPLHGYLRRLEHGSQLSTMQCGVAVTGLVEASHVAIPGLSVDARRDLQTRAAARGQSLNEARTAAEVRAAWAAISGLPASALAGPLIWTVRLAGGDPVEMDLVPQALLLRAVTTDTRRRWEAAPEIHGMVGALCRAATACGFNVAEDSEPWRASQGPGESGMASASGLASASSLCTQESGPRVKRPGLHAPVLARRKERPLPVQSKATAGAPAKKARLPAPGPRAGTGPSRGPPAQTPRAAGIVEPGRGVVQPERKGAAMLPPPRRAKTASTAPATGSTRVVPVPKADPPRPAKPPAPAKPADATTQPPAQDSAPGLEEGYRRELEKLRVPDLKKLCEAMGVKKGGRKGDLVERLASAMAASGSATT